MEIEAATLSQVRRARDGRMVVVDDDVANVVRDLQQIDAGLRVRFSEEERIFVVYHVHEAPEGGEVEELVATSQTLDQRLVTEVRRLDWRQRQPGYRFADDLEAADREAERQERSHAHELIGPHAEKLAWALRRDLDGGSRIFVPGDRRG